MFFTLLVITNIATTFLGIYYFDYVVDSSVNDPVVILLSILAGVVSVAILLLIYIEGFYYLFARRLDKKSKLLHFISKQLVGIAVIVTRTKVKVEGLENLPQDTGFSMYSNHTSLMDIPILMWKLPKHPVAFLTKQENTSIPFVGKWSLLYGCIPLDRENPRKGLESIKKTISNIHDGLAMVIFPEGTRSKVLDKTIAFRHGAFKVALKSKAPLVPVSIVKPNDFHTRKWPRRKPTTIVIHKPILADDYQSLTSHEISDKVKAIIDDALKRSKY